MKRILISIIFVAALVCSVQAQQGPERGRGPKDRPPMQIEQLITDLSTSQKARIHIVTLHSKKVIDNLRGQLNDVRDSIRTYMDSMGDNSKVLFPLYEREGRLQASISKEYYRAKVAIDAILTPAQYKALQEKMVAQRAQRQRQRQQNRQHNRH